MNRPPRDPEPRRRSILLAPDKFKGTLSAHEAAEALARGVQRGDPARTPERCPIADGGEGTLAALRHPLGLRLHRRRVHGPRAGTAVEAEFGAADDGAVAVVELAQAAGLELVDPSRRDPGAMTTHGVGELVGAAMALGCRRVIVGLGGSATCDGGCGLSQALGAVFIDRDGRVLDSPLVGRDLQRVASVTPARLILPDGSKARLEAACDVLIPLTGPRGTAALFAPQKGADAQQVAQLERGLLALERASVAPLPPDADAGRAPLEAVARLPGAGAAGGAGFGLAAFCGAELRSGAALVLEAIGFERRLRDAALLVVCEGRFDRTSFEGKSAVAAAGVARRVGVPAVMVAGEIASDLTAAAFGVPPFAEIVSLSERFGRDEALRRPSDCLERLGAEIAARWSGRG